MLQEWLEELAENEMKKTASSQFEEVLRDMDIPELKAFFDLNQSMEKQAQVQFDLPPGVELDPERGASKGRVLGGVAGGTLGALGGAAAGEALGRKYIGGNRGAVIGAMTGGLGAGALGALGGSAGGGALGRLEAKAQQDRLKSNMDIANQIRSGGLPEQGMDPAEMEGYLDQLGEVGPDGFAGAYKSPEVAAVQDRLRKANPNISLEELNMHPDTDRAVFEHLIAQKNQQMQKGAEAKFKQASDTGKALARLGVIPEVIKPSFQKLAQAPDPFAPRMVQADPIDRQKMIEQAEQSGRFGGGLLGGVTGGAVGIPVGAAIGERVAGPVGSVVGGVAGGALGAYGLGSLGAKGMGGLARRSTEARSDEELQAAENFNLANQLYNEGRISDEEMALAEQQFLRGPKRGSLTPQMQQIPAMRGGPGAVPEQEKTSSFRGTIMKLAADGKLPQHHGWEL